MANSSERPPIAADADPEYETRLDAERVTLEFASKRQPAAPQESLEDLPLFGGDRQQELF